jgi:cbb3-type cytochrome c oxidase subunit III
MSSSAVLHASYASMRRIPTTAVLLCALALAPLGIRTSGAQGDTQPADGAKIYKQHCATCHGNDGRAKSLKGRFKGATNLTDPAWQAAVTDTRIEDTITVGKNGRMPGFRNTLNPDEITALVAFVRTLKE